MRLNLKPWEKLPENFEALKYGIMSVSYPLMPDAPVPGVTYRGMALLETV